MFYGVPSNLRDVADVQRGVLSAAQLAEAGLSRNGLTSRVRAGHWQRLYRGVYATFSGELGREAQLWAAVLACGPGAMLSHQTAAEVAGLIDNPTELIHVTVPTARELVRRAGIVVHRSARAGEARHPVHLPPQTRVEETVLDLVGVARTVDEAVNWLTRGVGRRVTTPDKLRQALELRAKIRWRPLLTELLSPTPRASCRSWSIATTTTSSDPTGCRAGHVRPTSVSTAAADTATGSTTRTEP